MNGKVLVIGGLLLLGVCTGLQFRIDTEWFDASFVGKDTKQEIHRIIDALINSLPGD